MLAYVFWHWPNPDVQTAEYEAWQRDFHAALASSGSAGFLRSAVFGVEGQAPWLGGAPAYADWYLVEDSKALDPLNVAAVSGVCQEPHAKLAQAMAAGAGSLFTLRGDPPVDVTSVRRLTFLTKPREVPYADFYPAVSVAPPETTLWRRTMVLGPTPEFALLSADAPGQPLAQFKPLHLSLRPIWP